MKPEAQRIAIAQACGWEPCEPRSYFKSPPSHAWMKDEAYYGGLNAIPNYLNDLNAMREAEKVLTEKLSKVEYAEELSRVVGRVLPFRSPGVTDFDKMHTTAAQRAEAFLKSLNLWTDE
jgi:hypothetical protein